MKCVKVDVRMTVCYVWMCDTKGVRCEHACERKSERTKERKNEEKKS